MKNKYHVKRITSLYDCDRCNFGDVDVDDDDMTIGFSFKFGLDDDGEIGLIIS